MQEVILTFDRLQVFSPLSALCSGKWLAKEVEQVANCHNMDEHKHSYKGSNAMRKVGQGVFMVMH